MKITRIGLNLLSLQREYFLKITIQTTIKICTGRSHFKQFLLAQFHINMTQKFTSLFEFMQ